MWTSAFRAYSWCTSSLLQMSAAMSSIAVTGWRMLSSTTSLMTSTFLDMCEPFWSAGRST